MYFPQCIGKPALAAYDASSAGVVGAGCEPQDQHMVSNSASNLDGFQYVYRSRAHGAPAASTNTNTRACRCKQC